MLLPSLVGVVLFGAMGDFRCEDDGRSAGRSRISQNGGVRAGPTLWDMASTSDLLRKVDAVCERDVDDRTLRELLLAELRAELPFDAYAWLLTDPSTSVGTSPLADVPCLPELSRLIGLKYVTPVNRWTHLTRADSLHRATNGDLHSSELWRDLLHRHGVTDVASVVFRDQFGCWGFLDLWRCQGTFSSRELAFLDAVTSRITTRLRQVQADWFGHDGSVPGPVVLIMSVDLVIVGQTPQSHGVLTSMLPGRGGQPAIPAAAYNVAAQQLAADLAVDTNPPQARVSVHGGGLVTLRAAPIRPFGGAAAIAVSVEPSTGPERLSLFSLAFGLTAREAELVHAVASGRSTRQLSESMLISSHTVQDHLKAIFAKTTTHTRPELLAKILGSTTPAAS